MNNTDKNINIDIENNKQVIEMITLANEFCTFIEEIEKYDKDYVLTYLHRIFPILYLRGSLLPEVEQDEEVINERYVIEETWEYIFTAVQNIMNKDNTYFIWDRNLNEPIEQSLSENISDLYQDLKDFLFFYSRPTSFAKNNSIAMCSNLFKERWGAIISNALSYIHVVLYQSEKNDDYEI